MVFRDQDSVKLARWTRRRTAHRHTIRPVLFAVCQYDCAAVGWHRMLLQRHVSFSVRGGAAAASADKDELRQALWCV